MSKTSDGVHCHASWFARNLEVEVNECGTLSMLEAAWTPMVFGTRHGIFIKGIVKDVGISEEAMPWFCINPGDINQSASKLG